MSIEWIAPKPSAAEVTGTARIYSIFDGEGHVSLGSNQYTVAKDDVPEVCEVMMKFSGWKSGKDVEHACAVDVGKRIIERLTRLRNGASSRSYDSRAMGYEVAEVIVREECGLRE